MQRGLAIPNIHETFTKQDFMDLDRFFVALATTSPQIGVLCILGLLLLDSNVIVKINLFYEDTCKLLFDCYKRCGNLLIFNFFWM